MLTLADFSLGDLILSLLWLFLLVIFFWLLISIFADLWRSHDISGWGKALWVLFIIVLPFLGILIYLIARGQGMAERSIAEQQKAAEYMRQLSGPSGSADELAKLADLRDRGTISDQEFQEAKRKALS